MQVPRPATLPMLVSGLLATAIVAGSATAQDVSGVLEGRVLTADSSPGRFDVVISGPALPAPRRTATDARGFFRFSVLPVGEYAVRITGIGLRPVLIEGAVVSLGRTTVVGPIVLERQTVALDDIVVLASPAAIDPTTATTGATLHRETFAALPIDRNYRAIAALLPLANTSFLGDEINFSGASGSDNMYFIDGVNVTDGYNAAGGTSLPYNFVEAVEVKQGGYEAEYGQAVGGIMNVVTPSGTDEWRYGVNGFFTNSALAGESKPGLVDLRVDRFATYDAGITVAGPLVPRKLRLFAAYNPSFVRSDVDLPGLGLYADDWTAHQFAGKLSWQVTPSTDLWLSVFGDPTVHDRVGPANAVNVLPGSLGNADPFLGHEKTGGVNLALKGTTFVNDKLLVELLLYRHARRADREGRTDRARNDVLVRDDTNNNEWSGGWGWFERRSTRRLGAKVTGTLLAGAHSMKMGVEYQDLDLDLLTDNTVAGIGVIRVSDWSDLVFRQDQEINNRSLTVFAQDSWSLAERLRLNAGLRWDGEYLIGVDGGVAQAITNQWQPRLGLVFQPGQIGTQKVFASLARYYQQAPLLLPSLGQPWENRRRRYPGDPRSNTPTDSTVQADPCCPGHIREDGLRGEGTDELTIGYERLVSNSVALEVRGVYRRLLYTYGSAFDADRVNPINGLPGRFVAGNPGRGLLDFIDQPEREYLGLVLSVDVTGDQHQLGASYVLSRNHGNYSGQFGQETGRAIPGFTLMHDFPSQVPNSIGPMPNDRTHVLKVYGAYRFDNGFAASTFFTWQTGTPLSEYGQGPLSRPIFLSERGSAGRTPDIWDLNVRFAYDIGRHVTVFREGRLHFDILHVASRRSVVNSNQVRFLTLDPAIGPPPVQFGATHQELAANQINPNQNFGAPVAHQPPMTVRLGFDVVF